MNLTTLARCALPLALSASAALAQAPAPAPAPAPSTAPAPASGELDMTKLVTTRLTELKADMLPVVVTDAYCGGNSVCWMELRTKSWTHKFLLTGAQHVTGMRLVVSRDAALVQTAGDILVTYGPLQKPAGR